MTIDPYANCNYTITDDSKCTLETCCLAQASFLYIPSYGWNLAFAIIFGVLAAAHLGLGIWYKSWGFMVGMLIGLTLEVVGYVARVLLNDNPFDDNAFLIYLIMLTIAPVFISAAVYLTIGRLVVLYGQKNSRLAPRTLALTFMTSDFLSLVLQAAGGAIADTADDGTSLKQTGVDVMISGLILQAVSLSLFLLYCADFAWRSHKGVLDTTPAKVQTRERLVFKLFLASLLLATVLILIRSIFRVAELWGGFDGSLWNSESDFLILDGGMMTAAISLLALFHPGPAFLEQWHAANWHLRPKRRISGAEELLPMGPEAKVGTGVEYSSM